jgi:hypothetical protein
MKKVRSELKIYRSASNGEKCTGDEGQIVARVESMPYGAQEVCLEGSHFRAAFVH